MIFSNPAAAGYFLYDVIITCLTYVVKAFQIKKPKSLDNRSK